MFRDLMFGRREPSYVAFDILFLDGEAVRELPLTTRKSLLKASYAAMEWRGASISWAKTMRCSGRPAGSTWRGLSPSG